MTDYGIKISKKGFHVDLQSDNELNFTSKYPTFKILGKGDISFTTNGSGNATVEIIHNLGFPPAFFVWRKCTAGYSFLDATTYPSSFMLIGDANLWGNVGSDIHHALHTYVDSQKLYIQANGAKANSIYTFRYYYLMDLASLFGGESTLDTTNDYGIKVSTASNVEIEKEHKLTYSKRYKALQFNEGYLFSEILTLPLQQASYIDQSVEGGTYVDIEHNFKYPPFFIAFYKRTLATDPNQYIEIPYFTLSNIDTFDSMVSSFCDSTRVRISFWRDAQYGTLSNSLATETATIKCYIFTENLAG